MQFLGPLVIPLAAADDEINNEENDDEEQEEGWNGDQTEEVGSARR